MVCPLERNYGCTELYNILGVFLRENSSEPGRVYQSIPWKQVVSMATHIYVWHTERDVKILHMTLAVPFEVPQAAASSRRELNPTSCSGIHLSSLGGVTSLAIRRGHLSRIWRRHFQAAVLSCVVSSSNVRDSEAPVSSSMTICWLWCEKYGVIGSSWWSGLLTMLLARAGQRK